jgi:hypothetical protein
VEDAFNDVYGKMKDGQEYGPDLIDVVVQRLRSFVKKVGKPTKKGEDPTLTSLGLAPSLGSMTADIQAEKPIERVPASDEDYEDNVANRLMQMQYKRLRQGA